MNNNMSKGVYLSANLLFCGFISYCFSGAYSYRMPIPFTQRYLDRVSTYWLMITLNFVFLILCVIVTIKYDRNIESIYQNTAISLGTTLSIIAIHYLPTLSILLISLWIVICTLFIFVMYRGKASFDTDWNHILKRRRIITHRRIRQLSSIVAACMILMVYFMRFYGTGQKKSANLAPEIYASDPTVNYIDVHYDEMEKIMEPYWSELKEDEKLDILQLYVNIESTRLGLLESPSLITDRLEPGDLGHYKTKDKTITIDRVHLKKDSGKDCLTTILHECQHSLQHELVDALSNIDEKYYNMILLKDVVEYKEEFFTAYTDKDYFDRLVEKEAYYNSYIYANKYFEIMTEGRTTDN